MSMSSTSSNRTGGSSQFSSPAQQFSFPRSSNNGGTTNGSDSLSSGGGVESRNSGSGPSSDPARCSGFYNSNNQLQQQQQQQYGSSNNSDEINNNPLIQHRRDNSSPQEHNTTSSTSPNSSFMHGRGFVSSSGGASPFERSIQRRNSAFSAFVPVQQFGNNNNNNNNNAIGGNQQQQHHHQSAVPMVGGMSSVGNSNDNSFQMTGTTQTSNDPDNNGDDDDDDDDDDDFMHGRDLAVVPVDVNQNQQQQQQQVISNSTNHNNSGVGVDVNLFGSSNSDTAVDRTAVSLFGSDSNNNNNNNQQTNHHQSSSYSPSHDTTVNSINMLQQQQHHQQNNNNPLSDYSRFREEFIELQQVGRGDYGSVLAALSQGDGVEYAVKVSHTMDAGSESVRQNRLQEVYALSSCPLSPFLLHYYDAWEEEEDAIVGSSRLHIQTELFPLGNVWRNCAVPLPEPELWDMALQLSIGLHTMHLGNIAHVDIKPDNVFVKTIYEFDENHNNILLDVADSGKALFFHDWSSDEAFGVRNFDDENGVVVVVARQQAPQQHTQLPPQGRVHRSRRIYVLGDFGLARPLSAASYHQGANTTDGSGSSPNTQNQELKSDSEGSPSASRNNHNNSSMNGGVFLHFDDDSSGASPDFLSGTAKRSQQQQQQQQQRQNSNSNNNNRGNLQTGSMEFPPSMPIIPGGCNNDDDAQWGSMTSVCAPPISNMTKNNNINTNTDADNNKSPVDDDDANYQQQPQEHRSNSHHNNHHRRDHSRTRSVNSNGSPGRRTSSTGNHRTTGGGTTSARYEGMNDEEGDGRYVSPELLNAVLSDQPVDADLRASDVFSFGVSLAHLSGCDPRAARRGDLSGIGGGVRRYSHEWTQFVASMIQQDPLMRPRALKLMVMAAPHCPDTNILTRDEDAARSAPTSSNSNNGNNNNNNNNNNNILDATAGGTNGDLCFIDDPAVLLQQLTDLKSQLRWEIDRQTQANGGTPMSHHSSSFRPQ